MCSPRLFVPLAALATILSNGCRASAPLTLAPSTAPVVQDYKAGPEVSGRLCRSHLFFVLPLGQRYGMSDLVEETGQGKVLVRVTVDQESIWWLVGATSCHRMTGSLVKSIEDSGSQTAPEEEPAARARFSSATFEGSSEDSDDRVQDDDVGYEEKAAAALPVVELDPSAERMTRMVFVRLGRPIPKDAEDWLAEQRVVWSYVIAGVDGSTLIRAAETGAAAVGSEAPLADILAAGLP